VKEFSDVHSQIQKICGEIAGNLNINDAPAVDEADLSLKKLDEYHAQLQELQKEKVNLSILVMVHHIISSFLDLSS
jgi:protein regulator of cytokinesis 1